MEIAPTRTCVRTGCPGPAEASLSFSYMARTAWLDDLEEDGDPVHYDLCLAHADRLTVPLGWAREDRRSTRTPLLEISRAG